MKSKACLIVLFMGMVFFVLSSSYRINASESRDKQFDSMEFKMKEMEGVRVTDGQNNYGEIYGEMDEFGWLMLRLGERGLRIVNEEGNDIILIDKFGGIYMNGKVFINGELCMNNNDDNEFELYNRLLGFLYFLVIIALIFGISNFVVMKKK